MDTLNHSLFLLLNATPASPTWLISLARFFAEDLILAFPFLLLAAWLWGKRRRLVINTAVALVIAIAITATIRALFPHARPFVEGIGYQFLHHSSSPSFPSNHGTTVFTVAVAFWLWDHARRAVVVSAAALAVAWSRVYLGVHWPIDMVGALVVACVACLLSQFIWQLFGSALLRDVEHGYRALFSSMIRKGWINN